MRQIKWRRKRRRTFTGGLCVLAILSAVVLWMLLGQTPRTAENEPGKSPEEFLQERSLPEIGQDDLFLMYDRTTDRTFSLTAEELLPAALACEMDLDAPQEALKAQMVACYTLFCRKRDHGEAIACEPENRLVWTDDNTLRDWFGDCYESTMAELHTILLDVAGQQITYDGEPILAAYTAITPGNTENGSEVFRTEYPYLTAVPSPGDCFADGYQSIFTLSKEEFAETVEAAGYRVSDNSEEWVTDFIYTSSGNVTSAVLCGTTVTGQQLRSVFALPSAAITVQIQENSVEFTVCGRGHGVGLSQAGAVFLARRGMGYEEILAYYYPGTELQ